MQENDLLFLADPRIKANPYPLYERLRDETPVCRVRLRTTKAWVITRYDDVQAMLRDPRIANDRRNARPERIPMHERLLHGLFGRVIYNMLGSDEPDHGRLRGLVQKAFTAKRVEELRGKAESITRMSLFRVRNRSGWDLVADYALPLPTTIIAEMLGVPAQDRAQFARWSNALLAAKAATLRGMAVTLPKMLALQRYVGKLVEARSVEPKDDLITALVQAEEAGDKLSKDEMVSMIILLLIAGFETTVNLIANGTLALLENPEQFERLQANPGLIDSAVEEFVRYYTPIDYSNSRWAREDFTLCGQSIKRGDLIFGCISSANRDDRQFPNPDVLDVGRNPNRHIGFGHGIHFCLGAFLARLEAQVAFSVLIQECESLQLAVPRESVQWRDSFLLRGVESLPVNTAAKTLVAAS